VRKDTRSFDEVANDVKGDASVNCDYPTLKLMRVALTLTSPVLRERGFDWRACGVNTKHSIGSSESVKPPFNVC
jgi:hypothetical protein